MKNLSLKVGKLKQGQVPTTSDHIWDAKNTEKAVNELIEEEAKLEKSVADQAKNLEEVMENSSKIDGQIKGIRNRISELKSTDKELAEAGKLIAKEGQRNSDRITGMIKEVHRNSDRITGLEKKVNEKVREAMNLIGDGYSKSLSRDEDLSARIKAIEKWSAKGFWGRLFSKP